jgi:hypothetical protein
VVCQGLVDESVERRSLGQEATEHVIASPEDEEGTTVVDVKTGRHDHKQSNLRSNTRNNDLR